MRDLWTATRPTTHSAWSMPVPLGLGVNSLFNEEAPRFTADGLGLLFASDRPGGSGNYDIYMATRSVIAVPEPASTHLVLGALLLFAVVRLKPRA